MGGFFGAVSARDCVMDRNHDLLKKGRSKRSDCLRHIWNLLFYSRLLRLIKKCIDVLNRYVNIELR